MYVVMTSLVRMDLGDRVKLHKKYCTLCGYLLFKNLYKKAIIIEILEQKYIRYVDVLLNFNNYFK